MHFNLISIHYMNNDKLLKLVMLKLIHTYVSVNFLTKLESVNCQQNRYQLKKCKSKRGNLSKNLIIC